MAVGHGGQILLSDVSAALARSGSARSTMTDLGTHRLRDLTDPERVWQVVHPDLRRQFPPVRGLDTYSNNLPVQRSSLVGRDDDVRRVVALTQRHRIVTLTGVGGVGKTRLAVHAAAEMLSEFATVCFVELASVADPGDVADTIARALGGVAAVDPLATAAASLAGGRRLLVLDNCEHVIDSVASAVDVLTVACPDLSVVATSREVLGVDGEHVHAVRSLEPATTALDLFRERAAAAGVDLATLDRASIVELCRRLDGIPLAIELAAARTATLGIPAITGALADRLGPARGGRRPADDRHATMRATIEWSYRLLDADEQRMFRWLAVFPGGFELDAVSHAAHIMGIAGPAAVDHIESLVHKSMLTPDLDARGMRYRMLETMRAYALERLDEHNERLSALTALATWMTTLTDLPVDDPCNAAVERNAVRLEREADNWREAVVVATRLRSGDLAAALCGPPVAFFLLGRHDLADVVRPLLDLCDSVQRRSVLTALIVSASGATEPSQMQAWAEEVQRIDDADATGLGGLMRWMALAWRGDFVGAIEVCVAASLDARLRQGTRDMFVGIAVLDHFSLTDATIDTHGLIPPRPRGRGSLRCRPPSGDLPARRGVGDRRFRSRASAATGEPGDQRGPRCAGADPADSARQRLAPADPARSEGRGAGPAGTARRHDLPPVVRRPDPAVLRGHAARRARRPLGRACAHHRDGGTGRRTHLDDGLRRSVPARRLDQQPGIGGAPRGDRAVGAGRPRAGRRARARHGRGR